MPTLSTLARQTFSKTAPKTTSKTMSSMSITSSRLPHAKITPHPSSSRGHADHGWLNTYHTFSFASYFDPRYTSFGSLRVLNEDRVAPSSGFPTHPHRDAEIFSYILNGELTHRDSMVKGAAEGKSVSKDDFYQLKRGDVQFTTGGSGIAHSEFNEDDKEEVHFLQIWATPWKRGLKPRYHTSTFPESTKRNGFISLISPLKAGIKATTEEEQEALPAVEGTIPIHADLIMGASIIAKDAAAAWKVGAGVARKETGRRVYVHLPMRKVGAKVKLDGRVELGEGDGAFVEGVNAGDELCVESVGEGDAELVVLDSD